MDLIISGMMFGGSEDGDDREIFEAIMAAMATSRMIEAMETLIMVRTILVAEYAFLATEYEFSVANAANPELADHFRTCATCAEHMTEMIDEFSKLSSNLRQILLRAIAQIKPSLLEIGIPFDAMFPPPAQEPTQEPHESEPQEEIQPIPLEATEAYLNARYQQSEPSIHYTLEQLNLYAHMIVMRGEQCANELYPDMVTFLQQNPDMREFVDNVIKYS